MKQMQERLANTFGDTARAVLAYLAVHGPATNRELADALDAPIDRVRYAVRELCMRGKAHRQGDNNRSKEARYELTSAPSSAAPDSASPGWRGVDWTTATLRPGCLDHERIPSRRGNARVAYQPPQFYATSSVAQVRAGDR
ncbi:MAG: winged helix-turn-helix transcriptional regulator [Caldilinea sp.]